ncbi:MULTISPECIES: alpha/beta hydrolase [unclassified Halomonas]|uniref:alpha/beta hydrolase n=1 Tax=unclassified Halomonas TaxID=2609666 RepID=UPI0005FC841D|nr:MULTISPECIES: alpha/beta fold hydrolase [unclassified Halomonas]CEP36453.1 Alpha/beta hydrolase [Halomonas sp. R57-5]
MSSGKSSSGLNFGAVVSEFRSEQRLAVLNQFEARDGTVLRYRHYPSVSSTALILLHGSATDSKYLANFAHGLAEAGVATVYTPDMRGHGSFPARRGDIDYIEQLEDDLADLIGHIEANVELARVVVGGHSSGGGFAVRFAGGQYGNLVSAYLLLAPFLGHNAPTVRGKSGGWVNANVGKIIALSILNKFGVTRFNQTRVLQFNMPSEYRDGSETLAYSYRLMTGFNPVNFQKELRLIQTPVLLIAGSEDEAFFADRFESTVRPCIPHAEIDIVKGASHLGLVINNEASATACQWIQQLKLEEGSHAAVF